MTRKPSPTSRSARQAGFSLIELMVVIVILGGLIAVVGPNIWKALFSGQVGTAQAQMSAIRTAVDQYKMDHGGKLPRSLDELTQPDERSGEPYIDSIQEDPWGNQYELVETDRNRFHIQCAGKDGTLDTDDDIFVPEKGEK